MKHLFTTLFALCLSLTAANAQENATQKAPQEKVMTKEEKQAAREKKEADLITAFNEAGLTIEEQQFYRKCAAERSENLKQLKADNSLTAEERKAKEREIIIASNDKLKNEIGDIKFKALKSAQKLKR
jgi:flagellar biosynthesis component FlhA